MIQIGNLNIASEQKEDRKRLMIAGTSKSISIQIYEMIREEAWLRETFRNSNLLFVSFVLYLSGCRVAELLQHIIISFPRVTQFFRFYLYYLCMIVYWHQTVEPTSSFSIGAFFGFTFTRVDESWDIFHLQVCPICAARAGVDLVGHLMTQHGNIFKISFLFSADCFQKNELFCYIFNYSVGI